MNPRIRAILHKEFTEYRRHKTIVITMAVIPATFLGLALFTLVALPPDATDAGIRSAAGAALSFLFVIPAVLPAALAAYSVVGEREQGTLESLLITPITDAELLVGKALAAATPAVLLSWVLLGLFVGLANAFAAGPATDLLLRPQHIVAAILFAPLVAVFAISVSMGISARAGDARVAQQLAGLAIIPMFVLAFVLSYNVVNPSATLYVTTGVGMLIVDRLAWGFLVRLFDRERLLTRFGR
jgi:ABC-type transport system involved in multi-copper enzyme maturation permease subunit